MDTIQKDIVATLQYTLQTLEGKTIVQADSLSYIHGYKNILPGMEKNLEGKKAGDSVHAELSPEDAFGVYIEKEPVRVHKKDFGEGFDRLYEGLPLTLQNSNGENIVLFVEKKEQKHVTLSRNHPFAGIPLQFDATILSLRCAIDAEKSRGFPLRDQEETSSGSCSCC